MNNFSAECSVVISPAAPTEDEPERGALASFAAICMLAVGAASLTFGVAAADRPAAAVASHSHQLRARHADAAPMQAMLGSEAGCGDTVDGGSTGADAEWPIDAVIALLQKT